MTWVGRILIVTLAAVLSPAALAEEPAESQDGMHSCPMMMSGAADTHASMMEEMRARQQRLDELVAAMEAAPDSEKVDAVAAVVKELAAQRRGMRERIGSTHARMMQSMHEERKSMSAGEEPARAEGKPEPEEGAATDHEPVSGSDSR